jgi:hypothetical protein
MDAKKFFILGILVMLPLINVVLALPNYANSRVKRSPQNPLSPWCMSAFLNYPKLKPRFCPPNPKCKLTVGRAFRDCSQAE